ncbi:MAG TPA: carbohydrate ABC transporter permease [Acidimicrobiia bacterium]|jgi:alpha-glucoside transport system permease protein|nr:carbohydrate ABC transporter permease [Acidimicrobiia bacterium]
MTTVTTKTPETVAPARGARRPLGNRIYYFLRSIPTWVLWILVVLWTIPTFGLLVNSFRTRDAQRASGWWTALSDGTRGFRFPTLENYDAVLSSGPTGGLGNSLLNSASIAIVSTIIPIAIAAFAAYAFAWIPFKRREWLFIGTVALLAVPAQTSLIPLLQAYSSGVHFTIPIIERTVTLFPDMGLSGTIPAVWLTHTAFAMPFAIFLLHNYIAGLPGSIFESAYIDGADHFKIFWRLVLPLSTPVLAAFAIFQFLWTWNDYLIALTMIGGVRDALPATVAVASLAGEFGLREHLLTAGAFVITVVPLVVFFFLQRFFVRGVTAGSVKG